MLNFPGYQSDAGAAGSRNIRIRRHFMKNSRRNLVAAAGALLLGLHAAGCDGGGGLKYVDGGWNAALKEARADGKPILLNFGGPW